MSGYNDGGGSPSHGGGTALTSMGQEALDMDMASSSAGSFLAGDPKKHDDLRQMLDSSKESLKLEAMKRIIGMVARGRDVGDLFPAVVKNVVSKNIEIKKLVYVYLTRYAEEQQDVALLSISTFQRALKDPNQLIRASALRVLSSIRVPMIVPIVMLAIRDSAVDMSPFVRKTAAHAIPKAYSIDPDQKEELVSIIEKLLGDRTTLVVGSAVMAFEEVCPERTELIHKQFRKLCHLLVDVEEWGQVIIVNMLLRYARTQFVDPNTGASDSDLDAAGVGSDADFYDDSSDEEKKKKKKKTKERSVASMDPDHRLLLKSAKPLLQSRNASVVMATAQLYHHCAPRAEIQCVAKAMIRLLRSHTEVQAIVLNCIASMTSSLGLAEAVDNEDDDGKKRTQRRKTGRHSMFEPHLKNFFVRSVDPSHIKILKLEILTNLATGANIGIILREFQSYITGQDKVCVAATIQAIGRCAAAIDEVTDTCLNGLVQLLSNRDQAVVAESVVVIKKLLQTQSGDHKEIIVHMAKLLDSIKVPAARAAILWVLGEYSERVPKVAPDVLRKMAKNFTQEETEVKMQILNLATKLVLINPEQTELLAQYVFNLAKYDKDYDLRDRARFMRAFVFPPPGHEDNPIIKHAKKIFLAPKPAPVTESRFKDRDVYQLGSMSHYLNTRAPGYQDLPGYPEVAPNPEVRNVEPPKAPNPWAKPKADSSTGTKNGKKAQKKKKKEKSFYSDTEDSSSGSGSSGSSSGSGSESSSNSDDESEPEINKKQRPKAAAASKATTGLLFDLGDAVTKKPPLKTTSKKDEESSGSSSDSSESSEDSSSDTEVEVKKAPPKKKAPEAAAKPKSNLDLLLSLDDDLPSSGAVPGVMTPSMGGLLTPEAKKESSQGATEVSPAFVPTETVELMNKLSSGCGLQVSARFTRSPHIYSGSMTSVELTFKNQGSSDLTNIRVGGSRAQLAKGMSIHDFPALGRLGPGATVNATLGVNFNDTTQAAAFDLIVSQAEAESMAERCLNLQVTPTVGELLRPVSMTENMFVSEQKSLRGMNETLTRFQVGSSRADETSLKSRIFKTANLAQVPVTITDQEGEETSLTLRFAGRTTAAKHFVLVTLKLGLTTLKATLTVNCEKIVVGSILAKTIREAVEN